MVMSFGPETRILSYGPRAHANPGGRNDREWVCWPAWAFRVVAPEFRERPFNVLQKAVLGVLRASRLTATELGGRLGVHPELAAFVVGELQEQGRIDAEWTVTRRGADLLERESEESEESVNLVPGWVFRDPWSGNLWPFVASSLVKHDARTVPGEAGAGWPLLDLGTTGSPWRQRAWMQLPPDGSGAEPPDAREIVRAALRHKRLERRRQHVGIHLEEEIDDVNAPGLDLNRVSGIEPEPEPVFLVSFLYVPRDGDDGDWHACDFFGQGSDPALKRLVIRVAEEDKDNGLHKRVDRLLGSTPYGDLSAFRRAAKKRRREAERRLERALTIDVRHHVAIAEPLMEMLDGWLELRDLGDDAAGQQHRNGVLLSCRKTLERLFREVAGSWPLTGVADRLCDDRKVNEELLRRAARDVGLTAPPETLYGVRKVHVHAVADRDNSWRLRPLVVATLLRAQGVEDHPLHSAAGKAPDLLARIEVVTSRGGKAVHGAQDDRFDIDTVNATVRNTLEITGLLLNLPVQPIEEGMPSGQEE